MGINLYVATYRGYGSSNGTPTMTNVFKDSHRILEGFKKIICDADFSRSLFVMGRSLGSLPAIELAYSNQDDFRGLIVDSGPSNNLREWFSSIIPLNSPVVNDDSIFLNKVKLRLIHTPTLIIHGEKDSLIPVNEGKELYDNSAAEYKRLVIIPNADHNNLFDIGKKQYYKAIEEFVKDFC